MINKNELSDIDSYTAKTRLTNSSLSSSSLNESFADKKYIKNKKTKTKKNSVEIISTRRSDPTVLLNYESIFQNDLKGSRILPNYRQSTPNNQSFSIDSNSFFEKSDINHMDPKMSILEKSYTEVYENEYFEKKKFSSKNESSDKKKNLK